MPPPPSPENANNRVRRPRSSIASVETPSSTPSSPCPDEPGNGADQQTSLYPTSVVYNRPNAASALPRLFSGRREFHLQSERLFPNTESASSYSPNIYTPFNYNRTMFERYRPPQPRPLQPVGVSDSTSDPEMNSSDGDDEHDEAEAEADNGDEDDDEDDDDNDDDDNGEDTHCHDEHAGHDHDNCGILPDATLSATGESLLGLDIHPALSLGSNDLLPSWPGATTTALSQTAVNSSRESSSKPMDYDRRSQAVTLNDTVSRIKPVYPCLLMKPGSRFTGKLESSINESTLNPPRELPHEFADGSTYGLPHKTRGVKVEIKYIDLNRGFVCGYLYIPGCARTGTAGCTYFEGEIIGQHHGFCSEGSQWDVDFATDLWHWGHFKAFNRYSQRVRQQRGYERAVDFTMRRHLFMRWKELLPAIDHKPYLPYRTPNGFYYVCFNRFRGSLTARYHAKHQRGRSHRLFLKPERRPFVAPAIEMR